MDTVTFLLLVGACWLFLIFITNNKWVRLKNPEIGLGYALFRTQRFNSILERIAKISRKSWRYFFDVGVLVCLGILFAAVLMFSVNLLNWIRLVFIDGITSAGSVSGSGVGDPLAILPAIPGFSIGFRELPYFFVAIAIGAALHELAHGVAARAENLDVKSTGLLFFFVFFGAFVEPNEAQVRKANLRRQLRIYAAGAFVNLVIVILLLPLAFPPIFNFGLSMFYDANASGALVLEVCPAPFEEDCPASLAGLYPGSVVVSGTYANATTLIFQNKSDFDKFSNGTKAGEEIQLEVLGRQSMVNVTTIGLETANNSRGYIGLFSYDFHQPRLSAIDPLFHYYLYNVVTYTFSLSLILALMNLLPIPPLDGDKVIKCVISSKRAVKWIRVVTLLVFAGNIGFSLLISGVGRG